MKMAVVTNSDLEYNINIAEERFRYTVEKESNCNGFVCDYDRHIVR